MKNHSKLNNFVAKHSSLIEQFQKSPVIHKKVAALGSIINIENKNAIIRANASKKPTHISAVETPDFVIKNLSRMYDGIEVYNFQKTVEKQDKRSQYSKKSNRTIKSANVHSKRLNHIQNKKQIQFKKWKNKFKGDHLIMVRSIQNTIHRKITELPNRNLEKKFKEHEDLKKQVEKYKKKAQEEYGIKFNCPPKISDKQGYKEQFEPLHDFCKQKKENSKRFKMNESDEGNDHKTNEVPQFLLINNQYMPKYTIGSSLKKPQKVAFFRV